MPLNGAPQAKFNQGFNAGYKKIIEGLLLF